MSLEEPNTTHIQLENISDYAQFIGQATIAHVAHVSDTGEIVAFVEQHVDPSQQENIDPNQITLANFDPQQLQVEHVVFEQLPEGTQIQTLEFLPTLQQQAQPQQVIQIPVPETRKAEIKPPVGKGPFPCESCEKIFPKWNQLQRHMKTHQEDKPFRCAQCSISFNMEENLKLHEATHVPPDSEPTCPECGKTFSRVASLKSHIMLHEKEETLMCTECGDEFSLQFQLDRHMQEHRREQQGVSKSYSCKQCVMKFDKPALLREHMKHHYRIKSSLVHRPYKRNIDRTSFHYKCQHCGKMFQKPSQLVRHNRIHTGERPYTCTICDRSFNQKGALRIHMSKHTGDKPYICDFCPHTFAQRGNLRAHIKRVHTLPEDGEECQTFNCNECSCVFKKLGSLNAHISREHSEQTEIPLPNDSGKQLLTEEHQQIVINQINPTFVEETEEALTNEQSEDTQDSTDHKTHNNDILQQALANSGLTNGETDQPMMPAMSTASTGLTPIAPAPGTGLATSSVTQTVTTMTLQDSATGSIKKHIIRKVNGVRWHQCTYCAKEFKKPSDLVRHIRIHTHEKPYKCTQCFRSFAVKSTLTAHIKTHSGIKDFKCCLCNKMFSTQGSLKVHLRMHTGAKPFECPQCDKTFRTSAHRKSHITSHFKDGDMERKPKRTFRKLCKQEMGVSDIPLQEPILITDTGLIQQPPRNNLLNQYLGEATSVDRPYKCGFCSRGYKKSSHLKQHIRSHTGEKPYKCIQCMKAFVSSGVLKAHIRTHTGVKAYKCLICDSLFTTNGSLKRHMSTHSEVRPFMCPYCQKTFKTSVNCKKHMKTHRHELALQALQQNPGDDDADKDTSDIVEENNLADLVLQQTDQSGAITQSDSLAPAGIQDALNTSLDQQFQQTLNHQIFGQTQFSQSLLGSGQQNFTQLNQQMGSQIQPQNVMTTQLTNHTSVNNQLTTSLNDTITNQHVTQLNAGIFDANSFQIQGQPLQDLNSLNFSQGVTSLTTSLPSTSMQNILPTSDVTILEAEEAETIDKDSPAGPTQESEAMEKDDDDGARQFQCTECDKSYKKSSHLKQHMRSHTGEKPYPCTQCNKSFVSASILKNHIKTHIGAKDFTCPVCKADFTTNGSLVRHMSIHERIRSQKCPYCEESFKSHNMLKRHIKTHSDVIEEDIALNKRPKAVIAIFEEEQQPAVEETTKEEDLINISKKILVESSSEKTKVIGEKMISTRESGEHYPKHPHQCIHCPKSFKKPSDLVRHIRIHTGEKPFKCSVCAKSFTVKSTLDSHMRTHQNTSKNYKCHVCAAMFATKGSLKVHMRLHTGAKPFKCPHCDQRFRTSGNRKSHVFQHFKSEPLKRRKPRDTMENVGTIENIDLIVPNDVQNVMTINQNNGGQVIAVDQSMLGNNSILPVSLTVQPDAGLNTSGLSESALATQVLQGLEGIQLQLTGNQGLQITGLDPNIFSQTVQIDANLLQQLQQQGNINITINPSLLTQTLQSADPNVIQSVQVQQDPNIMIQPMSTITVPEGQSLLTTSGAGVVMSDSAPSAFIVSGDGTIPSDQISVTQANITEVETMDLATVEEVNEDEDNDGVDLDTSLEDPLNEEDSTLLEHGITHDSLTHGSQSANISLQAVNPVTGEKTEDDLRLFKCAMCDKSFKRSGHLKEHMIVHTPEAKNRQRPPGNYKCQHCNKGFQKPSQLERHVRIHTGERPFVCEVCSKSFNQKNALQIHMKKHSGEKAHKCSYCDLSFVQKGNLKTHIKRAHHMDMVHSMNIPKFYLPPSGTSVSINADGTRDDDGINYDEMADLMNVI